MQSAARVPILISFEVENYAGPDEDPILVHGRKASVGTELDSSVTP